MSSLLDNPRFRALYEKLGHVELNPRRHTSPTAQAHSAAAAALAFRLGKANGCDDTELGLLRDLGHAHDIGKVTGSARPEHSVELLRDLPSLDPRFLSLVKWHDVSLPWFQAQQRGEAPSDKAWRKLARDVDVRLLCLFQVADRVDAPGGWRRNAPLTWFLAEARRRALVGDLSLDLPDHPSLVSAGGGLVRETTCGSGKELLLIRVRAEGFELPKGGLDWDETAAEAACRELREETGVSNTLRVERTLGALDYFLEQDGRQVLKRVQYFLLSCEGQVEMLAKPQRTRERIWIGRPQLDSVPLVNEELRPLLRTALSG